MRPRLALLAMVLALAGCAGAEGTPTPTTTPSGDPFERPQGDPATGAVVAIGEGTVFDTGWRYAMYPTEDGWCAQIDVDDAIDSRCDDVLPGEGEVLGSVGVRTADSSGATVVDVMATTEVATVWLVSGPTARIPATGMPPPDGVEGQAWVGVMPEDAPVTHVQAVGFNGQVLDTVDLRE